MSCNSCSRIERSCNQWGQTYDLLAHQQHSPCTAWFEWTCLHSCSTGCCHRWQHFQIWWCPEGLFEGHLPQLPCPCQLETIGNGSHIFSCEPISKTGYWLGVCYGWFHLHWLTRAARSEIYKRITKWKILAHTGTWTHDPWFSSLVPYPWGYPVWYINYNLTLLQ